MTRSPGGSHMLAGQAATARPAWPLLAAALLATVGALGVFLPLAIGALFAGLISHQPEGLAGFLSYASFAAYIPAICLLSLVAAIGLYQEAAWGRRLGGLAAAVLVAGPIVGLGLGILGVFPADQRLLVLGLDASEQPGEAAQDALPALRFLLWHVFLVQGGPISPAHVAAIAGVVVALGLRT